MPGGGIIIGVDGEGVSLVVPAVGMSGGGGVGRPGSKPFLVPVTKGAEAGEGLPLGRGASLIKCIRGSGHTGVVSRFRRNKRSTVIFHSWDPHKSEAGSWEGRKESKQRSLEKNEVTVKLLGVTRLEAKQRGGRRGCKVDGGGWRNVSREETREPVHGLCYAKQVKVRLRQPCAAAPFHRPFTSGVHESTSRLRPQPYCHLDGLSCQGPRQSELMPHQNEAVPGAAQPGPYGLVGALLPVRSRIYLNPHLFS
ncbi:hypothetical protein B0F90DRAFT_1138334 [Multifurca ochricompacta]|uniref:Uncharacterized protein n=1 Tax=Multifurca ochricompacta TaxID=376703 RepID=A0AAD4LZ52_9AGAM|nr:hypothetical protein B0F90DRAFT_1138334 [Multifurca ochricompacta]